VVPGARQRRVSALVRGRPVLHDQERTDAASEGDSVRQELGTVSATNRVRTVRLDFFRDQLVTTGHFRGLVTGQLSP
jgi:hypothetical protein